MKPTTHHLRTFSLSLLAATLLLGLSACGKKDDKAAATQVAAKVGSEEISVHQINQVLSRSNTAGATPEAVQAMSREVLEKLIDQQLAVDQATEKKLHRSPEVVAQIEAARRDILTRAYMQQVAASLPKPSPEEIKKYFAEHPQLFSQRRIFNVQEIVIPAAPGIADQLRAYASTNKPIEEIAAALKSKDIKFNGGSATRAAEQIPLDLLPQVHALKDGQSTVLENGKSVTLLHLVSSQTAPIDEASAQSRIEQFLSNQRTNEALVANIKQLRANTQITYMGEFAKAPESAVANTPAVPAIPVSEPAPAPAPATATDDKAKATIEKGVAGLK